MARDTSAHVRFRAGAGVSPGNGELSTTSRHLNYNAKPFILMPFPLQRGCLIRLRYGRTEIDPNQVASIRQ